MSLINQVLKDVEKRRGQLRSTRQNDIAGLFAGNIDRNYKRWIGIAILAVLVILAIAGSLFYLHKKNGHTYQLAKKQTISLAPHSTMTKVKLPPSKQQIANIRYERAMQSIKQGNYTEAMKTLMAVVQANPDYQMARQELVTLLLTQNHATEAQKWLSQGLKQTPNYVPFVDLEARIFLKNSQIQQAYNTLQTVSPDITQYPEYYAILADVQQQRGNNSTSAEIYEKLLQYDPTNSYWWMGLGINLEQLGKRNLAKEAYSRALQTGNLSFNLVSYVQSRLYKLRGLSG